MPSIASREDGIAVELLAKAKARMAFYSEAPAVLVGADYQEWNRRGDHELDAFVMSDRTAV